jgi:glycosyltransferase involved in cell wall biosynthesis
VRIVALVEGPDHVCCRYRLRAFAPALTARGHSLDLVAWPRGFARWRLPDQIAAADVVVVQRRLPPAWELARLRRAARRLVFDFDDAVFQRDSYHPRGPASPRLRRRFAAIARACDAVAAGNPWLAERAVRAGAANVHVIPTCVDPSLYPVARHDRPGGITLVWVGSSSTLRGLERERPLLEHLGRNVPDLTLRLVCDQPIAFEHLRVEYVPWTEAGEPEAIAGADVGLSLLPDDDWSRGKCGLKVLQYLAAGLPVAGNAVGVTRDMVVDAGFLAGTPGEWVAVLECLRDPGLRRRLGAAGRRRVEERYSVTAGLTAWGRLLDTLARPAREAG